MSPSSDYSGLISLKIDWFALRAVQGTLRSLLQHHSSKATIFWHSSFFMVQVSQLHIRLDFPRETGLILRFAGKSGNPFQTKQGNLPSCRHQERRRGSAEAVLGISMFYSSETGVSGKFWGRIKGPKYHFTLQDGTWDFP